VATIDWRERSPRGRRCLATPCADRTDRRGSPLRPHPGGRQILALAERRRLHAACSCMLCAARRAPARSVATPGCAGRAGHAGSRAATARSAGTRWHAAAARPSRVRASVGRRFASGTATGYQESRTQRSAEDHRRLQCPVCKAQPSGHAGCEPAQRGRVARQSVRASGRQQLSPPSPSIAQRGNFPSALSGRGETCNFCK
jgi:hypothetical protein